MTARARHTDPRTSHEAAASIGDLTDRQRAVLRVLRGVGPLTDHDLVDWYARGVAAGRVPAQSPSGIRTRRDELVARGLVRDSRVRERLPSGRQAIVWAAVPEDEVPGFLPDWAASEPADDDAAPALFELPPSTSSRDAIRGDDA